MPYRDTLSQKLEARKKEQSFRTLVLNEGLIDFFSNDYLGFAADKNLYENILQGEAAYKGLYNGSTGSRLLSGNTKLAIETEEFLASFFQAPKVLLFNSGYNANVGVVSSIPQKGDTIIYDELIHASIKDGARLSFANRFSFRHNDTEDLERKIKKATGNIFIVIESIYSMDGDVAPLREIVRVCKKYNACLIVDEAHSTGVTGALGEGLVMAERLQDDVDIRIHTFGKAMGIHGACVVASGLVVDYLINFARSFIYTTAFSPHSFISVKESFTYLCNHPERMAQLKEKISLFSHLLAGTTGYQRSDSPIHVVKIAGNERVKRLTGILQENGFDVRPILSPTVKKGEERIRFCLHTFNRDEDIRLLVALVKKYI